MWKQLTLVWFLFGLLGTAVSCGGETTSPEAEAGSDWVVGSPCAINQIGDCYIRACWIPGEVDLVIRTPLDGAGPAACAGITWPDANQ